MVDTEIYLRKQSKQDVAHDLIHSTKSFCPTRRRNIGIDLEIIDKKAKDQQNPKEFHYQFLDCLFNQKTGCTEGVRVKNTHYLWLV